MRHYQWRRTLIGDDGDGKMMQAWFDRILAAPDSPTADLYFGNAAREAGWRGVQRLGPTVFATARGALVMRHTGRAAPLPRGRRLIYLVDDDVPAGLADPSLPRLYRQKLAMLEAPCWQRMMREADLLVATSSALAERLSRERVGGAEVTQLSPYWSETFESLDHHDDDGPIDIAYLGSAVHRTDLGFLLPVIEAVLATEPRARFHLAARHLLPPGLARHPRVRRLPGRGWTAYRQAAAGRRFHLALYPLLDTPFNRARSVNKLIEHGLAAAAPIYSANWPEAGQVSDGGDGLVRENDPAAWAEATLSLVRDAAGRRAIAAGAQALARRLNDPAPQRRLWTQALEIET